MMPLSATSFLRRFTVSANGYALLTRTMPSSVSARGLAMLNSRSPAIKTAETVAIIRAIIPFLLLSPSSKSATREDSRQQQDATCLSRERWYYYSRGEVRFTYCDRSCRGARRRRRGSLSDRRGFSTSVKYHWFPGEYRPPCERSAHCNCWRIQQSHPGPRRSAQDDRRGCATAQRRQAQSSACGSAIRGP